MKEWNKIEDGLPKDTGEYIVVVKMFGDVYRVTTSYFLDGYFTAKAGEITHWMSLPTLPKD